MLPTFSTQVGFSERRASQVGSVCDRYEASGRPFRYQTHGYAASTAGGSFELILQCLLRLLNQGQGKIWIALGRDTVSIGWWKPDLRQTKSIQVMI